MPSTQYQQLTPARVQQLATEILNAARWARRIDPDTYGAISYAGMCGGLEAIIRGLIAHLGGEDAAATIAAAFGAAYDNATPDAVDAILQAKSTGTGG